MRSSKVRIFALLTQIFASISGQRTRKNEPEYTDECPVENGFFADAVQCDRYYECKNGKIIDHYCPDGLVYDESSTSFARCSFPFSIDCSDRPELQPAKSTRLCPRQNGYFAHEDPGVCDKFYFCVDGVANQITCPQTLVFDPQQGQCGFTDQVQREGCSPKDFYKFDCPANSNGPHEHPRYPDPDDCQFFYICIGGTGARRNGCTEGLVFNPATLSCDRQVNVEGRCSNWYNETELERIRGPQRPPPSKIAGQRPDSDGPRKRVRQRPASISRPPPRNEISANSGFDIGQSSLLGGANSFAPAVPAQAPRSQQQQQPTRRIPDADRLNRVRTKSRVRSRVRRPQTTQPPAPAPVDTRPSFALSSDEAIQRFRDQNRFVQQSQQGGGGSGGGRLTVLSTAGIGGSSGSNRFRDRDPSAFEDDSDSERFSSFPAVPSRRPPQGSGGSSRDRTSLPPSGNRGRGSAVRQRAPVARAPAAVEESPAADSRFPAFTAAQPTSDPFQTNFGAPLSPASPAREPEGSSGSFGSRSRQRQRTPAASADSAAPTRNRLEVTKIRVRPQLDLAVAGGFEEDGDFEIRRLPNARGRQRNFSN